MMTNEPEHFVSPQVIAEHLDIEKRQVLAMTRAGKIPAHPIDPTAKRKVWRYKIGEVEAAIASGVRKLSPKDHASAETPSQRTMPVGSPRSQRRKSNG